MREEINGLDIYLKNDGNFSAFCKTKLPKLLRKMVVTEMVCGFKMYKFILNNETCCWYGEGLI